MGSGKSTLTALVVNDLKPRSGSARTSIPLFFFFDRTSRSEQLQNVAILYCCLLKQLIRRTALTPPKDLVDEYNTIGQDGSLDAKTALRILHATLAVSNDVFIVLDAFDECPLSFRKSIISEFVLPIMKHPKLMVKIFISSRPGQEFEEYDGFNASRNGSDSCVMEVQSERDIGIYIGDEFQKTPQLLECLSPRELDDMRRDLTAKADGM